MKIRTNYVSNSSSSSFILVNYDSIDEFIKAGFKVDAYSIKFIKDSYQEMIKYIKNSKEKEFDYDFLWKRFMSGCPNWMKYYYMIDYEDPEIPKFLTEIEDELFITDEMDRDSICEKFFDPYHPVDKSELFSMDL